MGNFLHFLHRAYFPLSFAILLIANPTTSSQTTDQNKLATANSIFGINLHKILSAEAPDRNLIFSPFSISTVLAMLYYGMRGESAKELRQTLGYDDAGLPEEAINPTFHQILGETDNRSTTVQYANAILVDKHLGLFKEYQDGVQDLYYSTVESVDFKNDGLRVLGMINGWVSEMTHGKIPRILDGLDPHSKMVLMNAVYFKGAWKTKFNRKDTRDEAFFNGAQETASKMVPMMRLNNIKFPYTSFEDFQAAELPYKGDRLAMLVLLPKDRNGLATLEQSLDVAKLDEIRQKLKPMRLELHLPRFKMAYGKSLVTEFERMGIHGIFREGSEDFSGISATDASAILSVTDVLHKAMVDVNEEGTVAAAATVSVIKHVSLPRKRVFRADHPFLFFILDRQNGLVLFMGRVNKL